MARGRRGRCSLGAAVIGVALVAAVAHAQPREVPDELVPILAAAERALEAGDAKGALAKLDGYAGPPDALHALLRGHALTAIPSLEAAESAYRRALALDDTLKVAALALGRTLVERGSYRDAIDVLAGVVDPSGATAPELGLYARAAFEGRDLRLASVLVERGIVRFPRDRSFRRLDVATLLERGAWDEAREAALALLALDPGDRIAWRQLAAGSREADESSRLAAIEAAMLANDQDRDLRRRHALAQLEAGHTKAALASADKLLAVKRPGPELVELGVRIAEAAGETKRARTWLARVSASRRTKALHLLAARLAIREGKPEAAGAALDRVIASGQASASVLLWAGHIADRADDHAKAEALYQQAIALSGPSADLARLHHARLLHRIGQPDRARRVLESYLARRPDDEPARKLLQIIGGGRPAAP